MNKNEILRRKNTFRIATGILLIIFLLVGSANALSNYASIIDNFNDNTINPSFWKTFMTGYGSTIAETNQRLEISLSSSSVGDPFDVGYLSVCKLRGDFDIQVDYELLTWPNANGVRVGLGGFINHENSGFDLFGHVERTSINDNPSYQREVYLTGFSDGIIAIDTTDQSGKLRLVRSGDTLTGYYYGLSDWVPIHSAPVITDDINFTIHAWSHDYTFAHQEVKVAFDNFVVNQGQFICQQPDTTPPIITIQGAIITNVEVNKPYKDSGATATDNFDGVIVPLVFNTVDTSKIGIYTVSYIAIDSNKNVANKVRIVNVVKRSKVQK